MLAPGKGVDSRARERWMVIAACYRGLPQIDPWKGKEALSCPSEPSFSSKTEWQQLAHPGCVIGGGTQGGQRLPLATIDFG